MSGHILDTIMDWLDPVITAAETVLVFVVLAVFYVLLFPIGLVLAAIEDGLGDE